MGKESINDMNAFSKRRNFFESYVWFFLTFAFSPFFYLSIFIKKRKNQGPSKILIIQTAKIGDLVCTTPIFRAIKDKYPDSKLVLLATKKTIGIIETNPFIDEIISIDEKIYYGFQGRVRLIKDLKKRNFNWSINVLPGIYLNTLGIWSLIPNRILTTTKYLGEMVVALSIFGNYRLEYQRHTLTSDHYLKLLEFMGIHDTRGYKREVFFDKTAEEKVINFFRENKIDKCNFLIGVCLTAGNKIKEWPLHKFLELCQKLILKYNTKIIFIGGPSDKEVIISVIKKIGDKGINSSGYFSLRELPSLLKKIKLFISVDTGPLYIASAVGTPVVDITGPIDINEQPPLKEKCKIIQKKLTCVPCSFMIPPARRCHQKSRLCLEDLNANEVFSEIEKFIDADFTI